MPWLRKIFCICVQGYLLILLNTLMYPAAYILLLLNMMQSRTSVSCEYSGSSDVRWCDPMAWTLGFYPAAFKQYAISRWPFLMQNPCSTSLICDSLHPSKVVSLPENNLQIRGNMHSMYSAPPLGQCLPRLWTIFKGAHSWGPFEMLNISCSRGIIAGFDYELHKPGNPFTSYLIPSPPPTPPPPHTHM